MSTDSMTYATDRVIRADIRDMFALMKPRVMSLVIFTGAIGAWLAPVSQHPILTFTAILSIAIGAGAAGAFNMWLDRDIDALMGRTQSRPLPAGRVAPEEAAALGGVLSAIALLMLFLSAPPLAALLLALAIFFYVIIYTYWLKRRTSANIVIGGAAGALPPAIGWVAVTGELGLEPLSLFLLIFIWTPPHFWALALLTSDDYARARIPMLPNVKGEHVTKRQILQYTLALVPVSFIPYALGMTGELYGVVALLLGLLFIGMAVRLFRTGGKRQAREVFTFSILYLFLLFVAMPL